ncbi:MAG TPA: hypothetical protein VKB46_27175 [Pyrinomonadaceae bacterium]|nr:hypothetical protein [Pyrinomonadaceae bacterium]
MKFHPVMRQPSLPEVAIEVPGENFMDGVAQSFSHAFVVPAFM